jgi:hypothetical protein
MSFDTRRLKHVKARIKDRIGQRGVSRAAVVFTMLFVCACGNKPPEDPKSYVAEIAAARASKDEAFKSGSDSPVPESRRAELLPLA